MPPTPCQPRSGDATLLAWGPASPRPTVPPPSGGRSQPLAAMATTGGCVHSPHGRTRCKAACPSRSRLAKGGGTRIRDLNGSAEPTRSLCRRRRVLDRGRHVGSLGDLAFAERRGPRRGRSRPHPPTCFREDAGHPSPAKGESRRATEAFQRQRRACAYASVGLRHAAREGAIPGTVTCVGAGGALHLRGNWRRAEARMFPVREKCPRPGRWQPRMA